MSEQYIFQPNFMIHIYGCVVYLSCSFSHYAIDIHGVIWFESAVRSSLLPSNRFRNAEIILKNLKLLIPILNKTAKKRLTRTNLSTGGQHYPVRKQAHKSEEFRDRRHK